MLSSCLTMQAYDGPKRDAKDLACVVGNMRVSGGEPVLLHLRRVDNADLTFAQRGACMLSGAHDLLIDCTVTDSQEISRHHLTVELDAGTKYRLVAATKPGNRECSEVQVVAVP